MNICADQSERPFVEAAPVAHNTALGSFLQFAGAVCYNFSGITEESGYPVLKSALALSGSWEDFFHSAALDSSQLSSELRQLLHSPEAIRVALTEYNALFHAPELPVPLWESVWLSREQILFTEETSAVRAWYSRFGWEISRVGYEAEDHIGLETAFCGWLYDQEIQSVEQKAEPAGGAEADFPALRAFLREHYLRWVPQCFASLRVRAETSFWKSLLTSAELLTKILTENV
ncbi:MAG: molecular chaperone TorD family protein [Deltaproteobacteria bacterium]|jgi:TorA maturation chaperone TorD|nr:molecular chaperone TorD family protein [Deltaproteobacteria bacterium]